MVTPIACVTGDHVTDGVLNPRGGAAARFTTSKSVAKQVCDLPTLGTRPVLPRCLISPKRDKTEFCMPSYLQHEEPRQVLRHFM